MRHKKSSSNPRLAHNSTLSIHKHSHTICPVILINQRVLWLDYDIQTRVIFEDLSFCLFAGLAG